jgi:hypothetical protein
MEKLSLRVTVGVTLAVLALFLTPVGQSAESDLSVTNTAPGSISIGVPFTVAVGYANGGPDTAVSAYVNSDFIPPMGLKVFMDNFNNGNGSMYDEIQTSALGTDTNGNVPLLFWDDFYCEHVFFQLQGDDQPDATPIQPLGPGASGSFTYELTLPLVGARTGTIEITSPPERVDAWTLTDPANLWVEFGAATAYDRYSTTTCDFLVGTPPEDVCDFIDDNCWGTKVSHLEASIETEFELVDDGSGNPTLGCEAFVDFTPGQIAVLRRGSCEFGVKSFNAEQAGARAVFMVNDGRCSDFPDSDQCVMNLGAGALGSLVTIPVIMVSVADGEPVIAALDGGQTITGIFGSTSTFATDSMIFLADAGDVDPDQTNDITATTSVVTAGLTLIFVDGFESGDTGAWSQTGP